MSLKSRINDLIRTIPDDHELLRALNELDAEEESWRLAQHAASWGRKLYFRNREVFLPLIERHLTSWGLRGGKNLSEWMDAAETNGDLRIYRSLLQAWLQSSGDWQGAAAKWAAMLEGAFREAPDRPARRAVLDRFDLWYDLPDETALQLYRVDPRLTADFVLKRLARETWYDVVYEKLANAALEAGDEDFYFELYRRTFLPDTWRKDVERLCVEIEEPKQLLVELERRHPSHPEGSLVGADDFLRLAKWRGRDVAPYLRAKIPAETDWSYQPWKDLLELAFASGWHDIYGVVVRNHFFAPSYNELVLSLVNDREMPEATLVAWLMQLPGARQGFADWSRILPLRSDAALALYERFPELLHGPFAQHLVVTMDDDLVPLAKAAQERGDLELVDRLTASAIARNPGFYFYNAVESFGPDWWYVEHYSALSERGFAERALRVLLHVEPFPFVGRTFIRQKNPLYALFFGNPAVYLPVREHVRDLLEAPNVEVRTLGLRVLLQRRDETALRLAANNVDHLLPYLLDEAPRATRIAALEALGLAGAHSGELAHRIHNAARAALDLRRRFYPRDRLIQLIGVLLAACPELQKPTEHPVIYEARS